MRRSASEIIRNLEMRIARLERQAPTPPNTRLSSRRRSPRPFNIQNTPKISVNRRKLQEKVHENFGAVTEDLGDVIDAFLEDMGPSTDDIVEILDVDQDPESRTLEVVCEMSYSNGFEGEETWSTDHIDGDWEV
jgi:hypothetical protein